MSVDLERFAAIVGAPQVLTGAEAAPYLTDWTGQYSGEAEAVLRPVTAAEVAAILAEARRQHVPVTVQGGNSSVSGGSVPCGSGGVVLSMGRMSEIQSVDPATRSALVGAGTVVEAVQEAAAAHGLDFPLYFAARGSAQIGGVLATNAGGANVVRFGPARALCLGLEAVMADGTYVDSLAGLRKDNSGYDLRHLLIGSEGTLGVITAARLHLVPVPRVRTTAFLSLRDLEAALAVLNRLQDGSGGLVEAFEWLPGDMVDAIVTRNATLRAPLRPVPETGVLVELASTRPSDADMGEAGVSRLDDLVQTLVAGLMADGFVLDGVLAQSEAQRRSFWAVREDVLETIRFHGPFLSVDAALPLAAVPDFVAQAAPMAEAAGLRPLLVAHLGDGNVHYAVVAAPGRDWETLDRAEFEQELVARVLAMGGTFSAEHGVGRAKVGLLPAHRGEPQVAAMQRIKRALDPAGLLSPGVLFPAAERQVSSE